jgi:small subunit ribosomal protein S20
MAIKANAKRAIRVSDRKRLYNVRRLSTMRESVKAIKKLVLAGDTKAAEAAISTAYKAIDKTAKRGVIKDNTASRKKSRLAAFVAKAIANPIVKVVKAPKEEKPAKVVKAPKAPKAEKAVKATKK